MYVQQLQLKSSVVTTETIRNVKFNLPWQTFTQRIRQGEMVFLFVHSGFFTCLIMRNCVIKRFNRSPGRRKKVNYEERGRDIRLKTQRNTSIPVKKILPIFL